MTETIGPVRQHLVVRGWHPTTNVNGSNSKGHWSIIRKRHDIDRDTVWGAAKHAGWVFVPGKVRLTITLIYPRKYRIDADNLAARCKGAIDGLHAGRVTHAPPGMKAIVGLGNQQGFFADDSTDYLELIVRAEVVPGVKELRVTLEPVGA